MIPESKPEVKLERAPNQVTFVEYCEKQAATPTEWVQGHLIYL